MNTRLAHAPRLRHWTSRIIRGREADACARLHSVRLAVLLVMLAVRHHRPPSKHHRKRSRNGSHSEHDQEPYINHHRDTNQRLIAFSLHDTNADANHLKARLTPPDLIGHIDGLPHRLEPPLSKSNTKRPKPHC